MFRRTLIASMGLSLIVCAFTPVAASRQTGQTASWKSTPSTTYTLVPVHGTWSADYEKAADGQKVLQILTIEGMTTKPAPPSAADVKALWGAEGDAFLKAATAPGAFPLAIARDRPVFQAGTISVDFKLVAGQTDQSAGIAFNIKPDGSYYFARYNTKDGNVAVWKFENGTRTVLAHGAEHEQLKLGEWHHLEVRVMGKQVEALANNRLTVKHVFEAAPSGRIGVWTKNDSVTSFRNFRAAGGHH